MHLQKKPKDQEYPIIHYSMSRLGKELEDLKKRRAALRASQNNQPQKALLLQNSGK